jgi:hypothetical protein
MVMMFIPQTPYPWAPEVPPINPTDPCLLEGAARLLDLLAQEHDDGPHMAMKVAVHLRGGIQPR